MRVIADTSVWSLALRRRNPAASPHIDLLRRLIAGGQIVLLGAVRQEVLSGIRYAEQYHRLKLRLRAFPDLALETADYELAAEFFNTCMSNGVTGGPIDLLICAAAHRRRCKILTTDPDFDRYGRHVSIDLIKPAGEGA